MQDMKKAFAAQPYFTPLTVNWFIQVFYLPGYAIGKFRDVF
jgi:hypothetical protein